MPTNHAGEPVSSTHAVEQTHDSYKQPADEAARAFILLDLAAEVELLHMQESWRKGTHTAKTLIKEPDLRIVVIALRQGGRIEKHRAPGRISIQTLTGRLHLQVRGQMIDLPAGRVLVLDPDTTHDVEAIDESAFLLTIAWPARAPQVTK
jgi:quercetin dioxygenase-like cupin family protein